MESFEDPNTPTDPASTVTKLVADCYSVGRKLLIMTIAQAAADIGANSKRKSTSTLPMERRVHLGTRGRRQGQRAAAGYRTVSTASIASPEARSARSINY